MPQQKLWRGSSLDRQGARSRATPACFKTSVPSSVLKLILFAIIAYAAGLTASHAQYSIYLKTEGPEIKGEANMGRTEGLWQLLSFSHAFEGPKEGGFGGSGTTSSPTFADIGVAKFLDSASVPAFLAAAKATLLSKVVITFVENATGSEVYVVTLGDVHISSVAQAGSTSDRPTEALELSFRKITWKYGSTEETYDLAAP